MRTFIFHFYPYFFLITNKKGMQSASLPSEIKKTNDQSSSQTSDYITLNDPECSFEKPFY